MLITSALFNTYHPSSPSPTHLPPSIPSFFSIFKSLLWLPFLSFFPFPYILFPKFYIWVKSYVEWLSFSDWIISLSIIHSSFNAKWQDFILFYGWLIFHYIHVYIYMYIHRYLYIYVYTYTHIHIHIYRSYFFVHSCVVGQFRSFHNLATVDNIAVNMGVHVSLQISVFVSFG